MYPDNSSTQVMHCRCPKNSVAYLVKRHAYNTDTGMGYQFSFACSPQTVSHSVNCQARGQVLVQSQKVKGNLASGLLFKSYLSPKKSPESPWLVPIDYKSSFLHPLQGWEKYFAPPSRFMKADFSKTAAVSSSLTPGLCQCSGPHSSTSQPDNVVNTNFPTHSLFLSFRS